MIFIFPISTPPHPLHTHIREWSVILQVMTPAKWWCCAVDYSSIFDSVSSLSFSVYSRFCLWKQPLCFQYCPLDRPFLTSISYIYCYCYYCYMFLLVKDSVLWKGISFNIVFLPLNVLMWTCIPTLSAVLF